MIATLQVSMLGQGKPEQQGDRLFRILKENETNIVVNKDGVVSTDFSNASVRSELERQLRLLADIKVAKGKQD